jgi:hypothetical protein
MNQAYFGIKIKNYKAYELLMDFEEFISIGGAEHTGFLGVAIKANDTEYTLRNIHFPKLVSDYLVIVSHLSEYHKATKNQLIKKLREYYFSDSQKTPVIWTYDADSDQNRWFDTFADYQTYCRKQDQKKTNKNNNSNNTVKAQLSHHQIDEREEFRSIADISQI